MRIKTQNNSLVIISSIAAKAFAKAKQYVPHALVVKEEKNELFTVSTGSFNMKPYGVSFNAIIDGKLALTTPLPMGMAGDEAKAHITEKYAVEIAALAKYESVIATQIADALAPIDAVIESIEIEEEVEQA